MLYTHLTAGVLYVIFLFSEQPATICCQKFSWRSVQKALPGCAGPCYGQRNVWRIRCGSLIIDADAKITDICHGYTNYPEYIADTRVTPRLHKDTRWEKESYARGVSAPLMSTRNGSLNSATLSHGAGVSATTKYMQRLNIWHWAWTEFTCLVCGGAQSCVISLVIFFFFSSPLTVN